MVNMGTDLNLAIMHTGCVGSNRVTVEVPKIRISMHVEADHNKAFRTIILDANGIRVLTAGVSITREAVTLVTTETKGGIGEPQTEVAT